MSSRSNRLRNRKPLPKTASPRYVDRDEIDNVFFDCVTCPCTECDGPQGFEFDNITQDLFEDPNDAPGSTWQSGCVIVETKRGKYPTTCEPSEVMNAHCRTGCQQCTKQILKALGLPENHTLVRKVGPHEIAVGHSEADLDEVVRQMAMRDM